MVICAVVLVCAVIISVTGMFKGSGLGGYSNAEKYTAGATEIGSKVRNLDVRWTSGQVNLAFHQGESVKLEETAKRTLNEDEKMRWWLEGETLRIQLAAPGNHWNMPEKILTVTLPEGIALDSVNIHTTSGDIRIPGLRAETLALHSTSGNMEAAAQAEKVSAEATSGDVRIHLTGKTDTVSAASTSGSLLLEAEKVREVKTGATSGGIGITAGESENVKASSTSGNIYVELRKMKTLDIGATSGSVTALLPEAPGYTADVPTTSGSLTTETALTRRSEGRYACGDGSGQVRIGTTSGSVRIGPAQEK